MSILKIRDENGNIIEIPALKGDKGEDGTIINLDQTYNPESENAQSGKAVAEAIDGGICDEKYFDITLDGMVSLKPKYRGACPSSRASYTYAISDNGLGSNGSEIDKLPKKMVIPEIINEIAVTGLAPAMFLYNNQIEEITIPPFIAEIPERFCDNAKNVCSLKGTENVTTIGNTAFQRAKLKKAIFPNLKVCGTAVFTDCSFLVIADIGNTITEIPRKMFYCNLMLSVVRGGSQVKTVGESAFQGCYRLKNLSFLSNLTSIGNYGFFCCRVSYDWNSLTNCTFGTKATPIQCHMDGDGNGVIDDTFWSSCIYTPCENQLLSVFNQRNPEWTNDVVGAGYGGESFNVKYSSGCAFISTAEVYSALNNIELTSPQDIEPILYNLDNTVFTTKAVTSISRVSYWLKLLGFDVKHYRAQNTKNYTDGTTNADDENAVVLQSNEIGLQEAYNALQEGGFVLIQKFSVANPNSGSHTVLAYGINEIGELLISDTDPMYSQFHSIYNNFKYSVPIKNITKSNDLPNDTNIDSEFVSGDIIVVRKAN